MRQFKITGTAPRYPLLEDSKQKYMINIQNLYRILSLAANHSTPDVHREPYGIFVRKEVRIFSPMNAIQWLSIFPFVTILLCIAILPLLYQRWWESNRNKAVVAAVLGVPTGAFYCAVDIERFWHTAHDYISFICLLGTLFIISGGIHIRGAKEGSPSQNVLILFLGSALASFIGTTGAAMLLIRPLIQGVRWRRYSHVPVVFFIFLTANIGGLLTPLGDPPLFMGFLNGVPFTWTFTLWREWVFMVGTITTIYYTIDTILYRKDLRERGGSDPNNHEKFSIEGTWNFLWLGGVLAVTTFIHQSPFRELGYVLMAVLSWLTTNRSVRERNEFSFYPINEVAILFAGIFACMIPCLHMLEKHGSELGVTTPTHFFWVTGILSSFLDNTPTYMTFFSMAKSFGLEGVAGVPHDILAGISLGAVLMGANTYIGNGPNLMVKAIAEQRDVKMPSFFGYMVWPVCILLPLFILMRWMIHH